MRFLSNWSLKFNPKIVTSYRSHGKWGDFIICLLPVSWCLNILTNSTTLLKILEWQSEANYFTVRVRGKQWYWVYKFDVKSMVNELNTEILSKKIGNNYKLSNTNKTYEINTVVNNFWKENYISDTFFKNIPEYVEKPTNFSKNYFKPTYNLKNIVIKNSKNINFRDYKYDFFYKNKKFVYSVLFIDEFYLNKLETITLNNTLLTNITTYKIDDVISRFWRNNFKSNNEIVLKKNFLSNSPELFVLKFSSNKIKTFSNNFYGVTKQKPLNDWIKNDLNGVLFSNIDIFSKYYFSLSEDSNKPFVFNNIQLINNSRLLKVNKLLVLPTNVHINIITNSFDVIHSWFIPGLGLKMDCVPGRSTHHTLYIDIPGMYYGQCAEICGRFHHHMPIRVCAMMYDHYYLWWYHMSSFMLMSENLENNKKLFNRRLHIFINK